jgi:HSP90 family molecular chaperone
MKISKFDIGAEVISILTRGMYPDPRDAVREYIQNAVDAGANKVNVKVRQNQLSSRMMVVEWIEIF